MRLIASAPFMSSTKPEVYNVSYRRMTEPMTGNMHKMVKVGRVISGICKRTDKQTNRHRYRGTWQLSPLPRTNEVNHAVSQCGVYLQESAGLVDGEVLRREVRRQTSDEAELQLSQLGRRVDCGEVGVNNHTSTHRRPRRQLLVNVVVHRVRKCSGARHSAQ